MPITVYPDRIDFTNYSLRLDSDGVRVTPVSSPLISGTFQTVSTTQNSSFQGLNFGYSSGGYGLDPANSNRVNTIDRFPFAVDSNATDVADLLRTRVNGAGHSSGNHAYVAGGTATAFVTNEIEKFPFATNSNSTNVGVLTRSHYLLTGHSSSVSGYSSGGSPGSTYASTIDKFPFASDNNATNVGTLLFGMVNAGTGQNSSSHGYTSGGYSFPPATDRNVIQKFPYAADASATDVGDLTIARRFPQSQSSTVSGYTSGGISSGPTNFNVIDKFSFASNSNATDAGDLTVARNYGASQSSTTSGYSSGGRISSTFYNTIDKFPFASDANATDVGDLTRIHAASMGHQY